MPVLIGVHKQSLCLRAWRVYHEGSRGIIHSLIVTCQLHGVDPYTYLSMFAEARTAGKTHNQPKLSDVILKAFSVTLIVPPTLPSGPYL